MTAASPNPHSQPLLPSLPVTHPRGHPALRARAGGGRLGGGRAAGVFCVLGGGGRELPALPTGVRKAICFLSLFRPQAKGKSYSLGLSKALRLPVNTKMPVEALTPAPQSLGRRTSDLPGVLRVMLTPPLSWNDHQVSDPKRIPS